ncbi:MAG: Coenzyme F420 hydrogenase/dehydrogenase, beta subunit C-terminal domain [Sphaerochaeta sp.]|uniref:Coenzyme F420 hydrogenase/dehydrogenase, beta subunit C-terminal domain n=1 Tax=Sphaerochaeta sp. TaxID=1972642 RepID=UPI003D152362
MSIKVKLCEKEKCTGCSACYNICPNSAIRMEEDKEGFLYPHIYLDVCISCGLCEQVCPSIARYNDETLTKHYKKKVFALKHKSDEVRKNSASGGAFSAITDWLFDEYSNNAICYGAAYSEHYDEVIHRSAATPNERKAFRGSKYIQSSIGSTYREVCNDLNNGKHIIFTGTPCQVDGLKHYLSKTKIDTERLVLCDIICHGVPSRRLWRAYLDFLISENNSSIVEAATRSKKNGWHKYSPYVVFRNGKTRVGDVCPDIRTFMQLFFSCLGYRPSCYQCPYANESRISDITIADFWGIEKTHPELDDELGVSLVLVNTRAGGKLIRGLSKYAELVEEDLSDCIAYQRNLQEPVSMPQDREKMWVDFYNHGFKYIAIKYFKYDLLSKAKLLLRRIMSSKLFYDHK